MADDAIAGQTAGGTQEQAGATWYAGFDDSTKAYIESKGLATKTAAEAFTQAAKSHREAEAHIGAPADRLLRLPAADAAPEAWKPIWERLGTPATPEGYDFTSAVPEGQTLDQKLADTLRATAVRNNLPAAAAVDVAKAVLAYNEDTAKAQAADKAALVEQGKTALRANWGANTDSNLVIARNAATALGVTPEAVAALEQTIGYDKVMELFRVVGTKIGEDKFITSGPQGSTPAVTKEMAVQEIAQLKLDPEFTKRYLAGGIEERRRMDNLHLAAYAPQS